MTGGETAAARLTRRLGPRGHWRGGLSSSALSTATAICALELVRRSAFTPGDDLAPVDDFARGDDAPAAESTPPETLQHAIAEGATWLADTRNADGGWGDTTDSPSNISTTILCWAALGCLADRDDALDEAFGGAESWLRRAAGEPTAANLSRTLLERYGDDRTFSVPILTLCALAGRFGDGREAWREVPSLPFEIAALPRATFARVGLPMVSYALPALIAIGQTRHHHHPGWNPLARLVRAAARRRTLRVLRRIQPPNGGFLEATPLTSFVTMSLVAMGPRAIDEEGRAVVESGVDFLLRSRRSDGSWPIDTDLATWVTTQSIDALASSGGLPGAVDEATLENLGGWLLDQQYREVHPYTGAPPGGWAWTDLPGGVPDADDTASALIALRHLADVGAVDAAAGAREAAAAGARWLLDLQNRDGGIPTFCRGWGKLPFDRSAADLTAHAMRAWAVWEGELPAPMRERIRRGIRRGVRYLVQTQRGDGAWVPLWFGHQATAGQENPLYGTARVLRASAAVPATLDSTWAAALAAGRAWIVAAQNADGGWGGDAGAPSSVEETGLALAALGATAAGASGAQAAAVNAARERGGVWLAGRTRTADGFAPTPIGLYFARLWYSEELYPLIFATAADVDTGVVRTSEAAS